MRNKVAACLRLSKEEFSNEKESNSITNQKLIVDNYLKEHKEYVLVDYYIDNGCSGTDFNRKGFARMMTEEMPTPKKSLKELEREKKQLETKEQKKLEGIK